MSFEILFVFLLLGLALFLFTTDYVSFDVSAIIIMACLMITGILSPAEGLSGFSNPATITVGCMFVLSDAIRRTGVLNSVGSFFTGKLEENFKIGFFFLLAFISACSAFINNTAVVVIFIPVIMDMASKVGISPSKLLMPLSFAGILGGVCTLIGTSTNILVSSIAEERGYNAIGMFDLTIMGLIFLIAGFVYLFTVGMKLIPERRKDEQLTEDFEMQGYLTDVVVNEQSDLAGTVLDHDGLTKHLDLDVIRIFSSNDDSSARRSTVKISAGDVLRIRGSAQEIKKLMDREDVFLQPSRKWVDVDLKHGQDALVEAVVAPESTLDGTKISQFDFYEQIGAIPLAIRHHGELKQEDLKELRLSGGDAILLSMSSDRLSELENNSSFVVVSELDILDYRPKKTPLALSILFGVVAAAALGIVPIVVSAITGVLLMIVTGCIKTKEAYNAVNWKVVMLLAGVLPLGTAMDITGAAELMASGMVTSLEGFGPRVMMSGFFLFTLVITAVMSNNASAALLAPIAIQTSESIGVATEPFLYAVTFAASLSFITPFGYQTNTMIFGAGKYEVKDFFKVGAPLNLLFLILATIFIPLIWPF